MVIEKKQQTRDTGYYSCGSLIDRRRYNMPSSLPSQPVSLNNPVTSHTGSAQVSSTWETRPLIKTGPSYGNVLIDSNT